MAKDKGIKSKGINDSLDNFFFNKGEAVQTASLFLFIRLSLRSRFMLRNMSRFLCVILLIFLAAGAFETRAQSYALNDSDTLLDNLLLEKQWALGLQMNTNGWGMKFLHGRNLTALKLFMWELEFTTYKEAKEVKTINPYYSNSKSFIYGKLNYLYFLHGGVGMQRILNRKPYWGGVQVSYHYFGGLSLGITKPVYLYIIHITSPQGDSYDITEERYNPSIQLHNLENIYGRAPFLTGITELGFYPGVYCKAGLDFEFGAHSKSLELLEAGATLDYSPLSVPIMAYNPKRSLFLTLYIAISFGRRHN